MFQESGYEATTMRAIATRCDVSLGNAYYYFESKEHLVLGLYTRTLSEQSAAVAPVLASSKTLRNRLSGALIAQVNSLQPYRIILRSLFKFGADPDSPLSPFGLQSKEIRQGAQQIYRKVTDGSKEKLPDDIKDALPYCLWLYSMSIIGFWLHDTSINQTKTTRLIELTSDLIANAVLLMSLPLLKPLRSTVLKLIAEFRLDQP